MIPAMFVRSACIALTGAIVAGAIVHSAPSSPGRSTRTCTTSQLKVALVHSGAAAGTVGGYIGFTNQARRACRLSGWPTLIAVSATGASANAVHRRSTMFGPRPMRGVPVVTLRYGERADAVFTTSDNPPPGKATCAPPYRQLRVTPPGNSRSVRVSAWLHGLNNFLPACTDIEVSMVVRASSLWRG
jgi:hypothetical protein